MRVGAMFSGGGGLELAVEALWPDGQLAWCAEVDRHAIDVHDRRWPGVPNLGDLRTVDWITVAPVDVLVGGYPCQPWSNAGRRKGAADDRDGWPWMRDAIRHLGPELVLLENVRGHVVPAGAGRTVGDLADLGYDAVWTTLRASDVGAPHRRERWFCVAYPQGRGPLEPTLNGGKPPLVGAVAGSSGRAGAGHPPEGVLVVGRGPGPVEVPADTERIGVERRRESGDLVGPPTDPGGPAREQRGRDAAHHRRATVADADSDGLPELGRFTPVGRDADRRDCARTWGDYWPAIERWEAILGRSAPSPTDGSGRLSPTFVEWMMGWPQGHVDGISRTAALRVLGNGVVPLQAATAYAHLLELATQPAGERP